MYKAFVVRPSDPLLSPTLGVKDPDQDVASAEFPVASVAIAVLDPYALPSLDVPVVLGRSQDESVIELQDLPALTAGSVAWL